MLENVNIRKKKKENDIKFTNIISSRFKQQKIRPQNILFIGALLFLQCSFEQRRTNVYFNVADFFSPMKHFVSAYYIIVVTE